MEYLEVMETMQIFPLPNKKFQGFTLLDTIIGISMILLLSSGLAYLWTTFDLLNNKNDKQISSVIEKMNEKPIKIFY